MAQLCSTLLVKFYFNVFLVGLYDRVSKNPTKQIFRFPDDFQETF